MTDRPNAPASSDSPARPGTPARSSRLVVGWREWIRLEGHDGVVHSPRIKVKVDTGARSSALHVRSMEAVTLEGIDHLRFVVEPLQRSPKQAFEMIAPLKDHRSVRSSSGEARVRPVVLLTLHLGPTSFVAEVTLTRRDRMSFRMLLGRTALRNRFLVDPTRSWLQSSPSRGPRP